MFASRTSSKHLRPHPMAPRTSVFYDRINRCHPFGNMLAVFSTLGGLILILAVSI